MAFNLEVSDEADDDTLNAVGYYFDIREQLANRFLNKLHNIYTQIAENPQYYKYLPKTDHENYRYTKLKSFPFVVVFRVEGESVVVYRVFNTYRKPWDE